MMGTKMIKLREIRQNNTMQRDMIHNLTTKRDMNKQELKVLPVKKLMRNIKR